MSRSAASDVAVALPGKTMSYNTGTGATVATYQLAARHARQRRGRHPRRPVVHRFAAGLNGIQRARGPAGGVGYVNSCRVRKFVWGRLQRCCERRAVESRFPFTIWGGRFLLVSPVYLLSRRALAVAALRFRSREFKELEIVVLRHELAVLRR